MGSQARPEYGQLNAQPYYIAGGVGSTHLVIGTYRNILSNAPC